MSSPEIHNLELKEAILHDRLCSRKKLALPYTIALAPGMVNLGLDICSYDIIGPDQALVSRAKVNFKRFLRAYGGAWRHHGIVVDLSIGINPQMVQRQQVMLASLPAHHAQRCEAMFVKLTGDSALPECSLWSEDFDPYIVLGMEQKHLLRPPDFVV